jgi:hypothetical protein
MLHHWYPVWQCRGLSMAANTEFGLLVPMRGQQSRAETYCEGDKHGLDVHVLLECGQRVWRLDAPGCGIAGVHVVA